MEKLNGCGACGGFWSWFKPPHYKFFEEECNKHDIAYNEGITSLDRKIADLTLLRNMRVKVNSYFVNRKYISRQWYLILCYMYYLGLRLGGSLPIDRINPNKQ